VLWGECIAGALCTSHFHCTPPHIFDLTCVVNFVCATTDTGDFVRICQNVGFTDPRILSMDPVAVTDPELKDIVGEAQFYSITYRLFKLPGLLETECEDYGQVSLLL